MMNNNIYLGNTITLRDVQRILTAQLPASWQLTPLSTDTPGSTKATLSLCAPNGQCASVLLELRKQLEPSTVPNVADILHSRASSTPSATLLVGVPYLSERTRDKLQAAGISYVDLTGNTLFTVNEPAVFLQTRGLDKNPNRGARPLRTLRGVRTAQIVRVLADYRAPLGVRQIAELSGANAGNVSRVLSLLESEALIERSPRGGVERVDWAELLRTWARSYSVTGSNTHKAYLDPRGLPHFLSNMQALPGGARYAITGSLAAAHLAPIAPARMGIAYVDDAEGIAAKLGLIPAESGANVLLLESGGEFAFERTQQDEGTTYVAASQAVVDLLTGPGRNPSEGEALIEWMKRHEDDWRTR